MNFGLGTNRRDFPQRQLELCFFENVTLSFVGSTPIFPSLAQISTNPRISYGFNVLTEMLEFVKLIMYVGTANYWYYVSELLTALN